MRKKLNLESYNNIFINKKYKLGTILDSITDPNNNVGAIYRSARAFGIEFVINPTRNSLSENAHLLNTACGAFEAINTFRVNNISNAIKKFKENDWWIVGLDHKASLNINAVTKKFLNMINMFFFRFRGKGIEKTDKENCNFVVSIPNHPNTNDTTMYLMQRQSFFMKFTKDNYI